MTKPRRIQLIVQVRYGDDMPENLLAFDDDLDDWLGGAHENDNCDPMNFGMNFYILTDDPHAAFRSVRAWLGERGWTRLLRGAAYRKFTPEEDNPNFIVIWPEGSPGPFEYDYNE